MGDKCYHTMYLEFAGVEIEVDVEFRITPYSPARLYPNDLAHPEEGGEVEGLVLSIGEHDASFLLENEDVNTAIREELWIDSL